MSEQPMGMQVVDQLGQFNSTTTDSGSAEMDLTVPGDKDLKRNGTIEGDRC
eukprot:CAMPEP_0194035988 /NCGR_PEP_ID=MMETSP0009_2-20130614/8396_1 /TAXON_ID=210454 /ORGANISM="Grammatophora oceanica, Strain CCMP 410" /LENGTH=50 /DNA_ID=CAMNT_0038677571 /DNA_START=112 /DNA_END=261 /DNA_ORIENTATION=+